MDRKSGAYWAARAAIAGGQPELAPDFLSMAARSPQTFYGMIAERQLGLDPGADPQAYVLAQAGSQFQPGLIGVSDLRQGDGAPGAGVAGQHPVQRRARQGGVAGLDHLSVELRRRGRHAGLGQDVGLRVRAGIQAQLAFGDHAVEGLRAARRHGQEVRRQFGLAAGDGRARGPIGAARPDPLVLGRVAGHHLEVVQGVGEVAQPIGGQAGDPALARGGGQAVGGFHVAGIVGLA